MLRSTSLAAGAALLAIVLAAGCQPPTPAKKNRPSTATSGNKPAPVNNGLPTTPSGVRLGQCAKL